jgi:aminoglycoside 6'-N-acetyltransferase
MTEDPGASGAPASGRPVLTGAQVTIRPGAAGDVRLLRAILAEPSVARWWGEPDPAGVIEADLRGDEESVLLVMEIGGEVAGGIQFAEETDAMYRHAGIDIYLAARFQGRGAGREAVALLARYLFEQRGHHRLTIDPAAANEQAIRSYTAVGFRPVGVLRQYERGPDGTFHDGLLMDLLRGELIVTG